MKLSAYRESLLSLTDQVLADYELQVLLQPTSTKSPYFGQDLKSFVEKVFSTINSPQILTATSIGGTPIPGLTDLDTLPGKNQFTGDKMAPSLKARAAVSGTVDSKVHSGANPKDLSRQELLKMLKDLSRQELLEMLKLSLGSDGGPNATRTPASRV